MEICIYQSMVQFYPSEKKMKEEEEYIFLKMRIFIKEE